jgi:3'-phosphoadenosine 5'-phosphosulfate (PAPS) 3'-phosphatase
MSSLVSRASLGSLCVVSRHACSIIAEVVSPFYESIKTDETAKLKADKSVFTIADGVVQHLLINHLFIGKFADIVGEEDDSNVNILVKPYFVDDIAIPEKYFDIIDSVRAKIDDLSSQIDPNAYKDLSVFIDPIDGTREFSTGKL